MTETFHEERHEEAPEITPQVLHLRDLLKWVRQGRIRVPNFQRDFTWDRPRMLNLFDSIRRQYPIGTLLFWETTKDRPSSPSLGPLQLPVLPGTKLLVLDGQQRLTTLAGVLLRDELPASTADDQDPGRWKVCYDAHADLFAYFKDDDRPESAVDVVELMGTKGLYGAAQRMMPPSLESTEATKRARWVERIEGVSAALAAYRVPLVVFATDSLRLAVESFTRVNRSGQSLGPDEMFSALTYRADGDTETFRLAQSIDSILAEISGTGFGPVDRVIVLRTVLLAADLDPFRTEWDSLAAERNKEVASYFPAAIEEARRGLLAAVEFLSEEGIRNGRLLPYSMQLVGLAAFFGKRLGPPTEAQKALLRKWLWVSGFTEGFGGFNPSRILLQLKDLRGRVVSEDSPTEVAGIDLDAPAHPFPERHDHRSARVRAFLCVFLNSPVKGPEGVDYSPESMAEEVLKRGPQALVRICRRVPSSDRVPLVSSTANRLFDVVPTRPGQAKGWLQDLPDNDERQLILSSHHISSEAWHALAVEQNHTRFVEERIKTLTALERRFMELKGVKPPTDSRPAPSAIDIEDEAPLSEDSES